MNKPTLHYVQFPGNLGATLRLMNIVTEPLARSGFTFQPDSEILQLYTYSISTHGENRRSRIAGDIVASVNENGGIEQPYVYSPREVILTRTREVYLDMIGQSPIGAESIRPEATLLRDANDLEILPDDWQNQPEGMQFKDWLKAYLRANQDPYPRLAILTADFPFPRGEYHMGPVLKAFSLIATDISDAVEIKPKGMKKLPSGEITNLTF